MRWRWSSSFYVSIFRSGCDVKICVAVSSAFYVSVVYNVCRQFFGTIDRRMKQQSLTNAKVKCFPIDSLSFVALFVFVCVPNLIWFTAAQIRWIRSYDASQFVQRIHNGCCFFSLYIIYGTVNTLSLIAKEPTTPKIQAILKFNKSKSKIYVYVRESKKSEF